VLSKTPLRQHPLQDRPAKAPYLRRHQEEEAINQQRIFVLQVFSFGIYIATLRPHVFLAASRSFFYWANLMRLSAASSSLCFGHSSHLVVDTVPSTLLVRAACLLVKNKSPLSL
jgi:hypothetical protein